MAVSRNLRCPTGERAEAVLERWSCWFVWRWGGVGIFLCFLYVCVFCVFVGFASLCMMVICFWYAKDAVDVCVLIFFTLTRDFYGGQTSGCLR